MSDDKPRTLTIKDLALYAPTELETDTAKQEFVRVVRDQILGTDKSGNPRAVVDLIFFLQVCKSSGLNPLAKDIYAVYRYNSRTGKEEMSVQASIDGFRKVAERSGLYAGSDDGVFNPDSWDKGSHPESATIVVYKLNKKTGERMPTTATARWDEYYPGDKLSTFWKKMPSVMLEKCAEAKALRKAFPNELSQVYVEEEMMQAERIVKPSINEVDKNKIAEDAKKISSKLGG